MNPSLRDRVVAVREASRRLWRARYGVVQLATPAQDAAQRASVLKARSA